MGNEMHVIENEFLRVAVAPHGAELCSIYDKALIKGEPAQNPPQGLKQNIFKGQVREGGLQGM